MDYPSLFSAVNGLGLLGWIVLVLAPRRWVFLGAVPRFAIPLLISVLYTGLVAVHFAASGGGYGSIEAVRQLFASDAMLVAGWAHFIAFDLLIGCFCADRLDRSGVHRVVQAPVLLSVFMFGPVGLLLTFLIEGGLWLLRQSAATPKEA